MHTPAVPIGLLPSIVLSRVSTFCCKQHVHPTNSHVLSETSVDVGMQGAIFRGIYNIHTTPHFTCTSNCTWKDSYISLGFASKCQNVTESTFATLTFSKVALDLAAPSIG